jgi:AcrR family transcriptional regulator
MPTVPSDTETTEPPRRRTKAERSEETRALLVTTARALFAERGYAAVGTEEIVRNAGITRGALYHHFGGKKDLLEAVYCQVEEELTQEIGQLVLREAAESPLAAMETGARAFIEACSRPEVERIVLLDSPAVLGWDRWREIASSYGLGLIEASLAAAMEAGEIERRPVRPLAHILMGAMDEAAMLAARSHDPADREAVGDLLAWVLSRLAGPAAR